MNIYVHFSGNNTQQGIATHRAATLSAVTHVCTAVAGDSNAKQHSNAQRSGP